MEAFVEECLRVWTIWLKVGLLHGRYVANVKAASASFISKLWSKRRLLQQYAKREQCWLIVGWNHLDDGGELLQVMRRIIQRELSLAPGPSDEKEIHVIEDWNEKVPNNIYVIV